VAESAALGGPPGYVPAGAAPATIVGQLLEGDPPVVAAAAPPTARDARGHEVPVAYAIDGDVLAVTVDPPADAVHPITVDPSWTTTPEPGATIVRMSRDAGGVTTTTASRTTPVPWSSVVDEDGVDDKAVARIAGCYRRKVWLSRESVGVFLFGLSLEKKWCGSRGRIRRQSREARASVGWNWDLVGRPRSGTRMYRADYGESWAKAHFRLDYSPFYTQNKFPAVGVHFNSVGGSRTWQSCC